MADVGRLCCILCMVGKLVVGLKIQKELNVNEPVFDPGNPRSSNMPVNTNEILDECTVPLSPGGSTDCDDGLSLYTEGREKPMQVTNTRNKKSGRELAQLWNTCSRSKDLKELMDLYATHYEDVVASKSHNFMYVDNVKAGSSGIRGILAQALSITWKTIDTGAKPSMTGHEDRYTTKDVPEQADMFKWSIVRDPIVKFESGVRQALSQDPRRFSNMTADDILDEVISNYEHGKSFPNEHLEPSSYRLSAFDAGATPSMIHLDFLGQLERFGEHWPDIVASMQNLDGAARYRLDSGIGQANARPRDPRSLLSQAGIRKMCNSLPYRFEWTCFGYELPEACK